MDHHFVAELKEGSIYLHDNLQFELKSEFDFNQNIKNNIFIQEFYIFIPESLHINPKNYSKNDFYQDQTNFIRYKTPQFTFNEILNPAFIKSPLNYIPLIKIESHKSVERIIQQIKLFGNIFRSTIRNETLILINLIETAKEINGLDFLHSSILQFTENIVKTHKSFVEMGEKLKDQHNNQYVNENILFVDEFITNIIDYYLIGLLEEIRHKKFLSLKECDDKICKILIHEKKHLEKKLLSRTNKNNDEEKNEMIAYRQSLLQKFMFEALQLKSNRIAISDQHGPLLGSIAAGIAMMSYMLLFLFTWKSPAFMINSIPFVLSVVIFYVLKDRIKEGIKSYYKQKAVRWFYDYKTKIYSPEDVPIGELSENFCFIEKSELPNEIHQARNKGFNNHLENLHRHETIIYYKRVVNLFRISDKSEFMNKLNMIFRYNIHHYLEKASDPIQYKTSIEENNLSLKLEKIPKIYHLNIIMKEINPINPGKMESKLNKFRVYLDKQGIQKIENLDYEVDSHFGP